MVVWPAVLKFVDDDELTFMPSLAAMGDHPDLRDIQFNPGDVLIDSDGKVFALQNDLNPVRTTHESAELMTLEAIIDLLRRHASLCGECCISKISAPSIAAAIALIESIQPR